MWHVMDKGFCQWQCKQGVETWAGIIETTCLLSALFRLVCMVPLKRALAPLMGHKTGFLHGFPDLRPSRELVRQWGKTR